MGACFQDVVFDTTDEDTALQRFEQHQREECWEHGNGTYAGHLGIKAGVSEPTDKVFETYDAARDYVCENNSKWESAYMVRFKQPSKRKPKTKRHEDLERRAKQAEREAREFPGRVLTEIKGTVSKTIGCGTCKSSIARVYLRNLHCPVCGQHHAFLTTTNQAKLDRIRATKSKLNKELKEVVVKRDKESPEHKIVFLIGGWCPE